MFKQKRTTLDKALALLAQYRQIPIQLLDVRLEEAVQLAATLNVYAYVIQCARQTGAAVLSLDGGLREAARRAGVPVLEVTP